MWKLDPKEIPAAEAIATMHCFKHHVSSLASLGIPGLSLMMRGGGMTSEQRQLSDSDAEAVRLLKFPSMLFRVCRTSTTARSLFQPALVGR